MEKHCPEDLDLRTCVTKPVERVGRQLEVVEASVYEFVLVIVPPVAAGKLVVVVWGAALFLLFYVKKVNFGRGLEGICCLVITNKNTLRLKYFFL